MEVFTAPEAEQFLSQAAPGVAAGPDSTAPARIARRCGYLPLASVKSNLGHTQAAAGVAGVIKMVLAMRHGFLPRTLHVDRPSSQVDWTAGAVELLTAATVWPRTGRPRRAAVSSFGGSGTNAHVVLEQPSPVPSPAVTTIAGSTPWAVSAKSAEAATVQLGRLRALDAGPADVGFTLARTRSAFPHRAVLLAGTGDPVEVARGTATAQTLAFVFPGPGERWAGAGRELYRRFPAFAAAFDEVVAALGGTPAGDRVCERAFVVEVALFRLLESFGVRPDVVAGQSIGEIAAAQVAGVLSLPAACALVQAFGRVTRAAPASDARPALVDEFLAVAGSLTFGEPRIPLVTAGDLRTAGYWSQHVRSSVRFADASTELVDSGVTACLEVGPQGVLTKQIDAQLAVPALGHDRSEADSLLAAVARLWTVGVPVDWPAVVPAGRRVDLPTYPFQRQRFWPRPAARPGDPAPPAPGTGQPRAAHPMLGAAIPAGHSGAVLFTGRLSVAAQPWLARTGRLPAAGLVDLALNAGGQVGHGRIDELTLFRPLTAPPDGVVFVKVEVAAPGPTGGRAVHIYSRREGDPAGSWTEHAGGVLVAGGPSGAADGGGRRWAGDAGVWPPPHAVPTDHGAHPLLRGVWCYRDETYVEAALPAGAGDAGRYGIHPALLDAVIAATGRTVAPDGTPLVPLRWTGISLHTRGSSVLRARITRTRPDETSIVAADDRGVPVLSVDSLAWAAPVDDLSPVAAGHGDLLRLTWVPIGLPADPDVTPDTVVVPIASGRADAAADACALTAYALNRIQQWLAEDRPPPARLVFTTREAVAAGPGDPVDDIAAAAVWGLVRAAQA